MQAKKLLTRYMDSFSSNRPLSQSFFEELLISFLDREGASKKTQKNYLSDVRNFLNYLKINHRIYEITLEHINSVKESDIQAYIEQLSKSFTPSTGVRHLSSIRTLFRALLNSGLIKNNPAENYAKAKQNKPQRNLNEELVLIQWEMHRMKQGHALSEIQDDLNHVQDFFLWVKTNRVKNMN